ncbi:MAG: hypothetical protein JKX76_15370 [Colwellia sp.]|nr:hypothetical protein [Colwellia sp.]
MSEDAKRKSISIVFPADGVVGTFQRILSENDEILSNKTMEVVIDLSKVKFIEVVTQIYLLAFLNKRISSGKYTKIDLPKNKSVRNALRIWRFPDAIKEITDRGFYSLTTERSKAYFGENQTKVVQSKSNSDIAQIEDWLPKNVLTITVFKGSLDYGLALQVAETWKQRNIQLIFERLFKGSNNEFSSNIVYESIANAVRHPSAKKVVVASSLQARAKEQNNKTSPNGYLTLVIWDDGESIVDTIRKGLERNGTVRHWKNDSFNFDYKLRIKKSGKTTSEKIISSDYSPSLDDDNEVILLSSLLPGITSRPEKENSTNHPSRTMQEDTGKPGMGLFLLLHTATVVFSGSVLIRTKDLYASIKCKNINDTKRFECKIENSIGENSFSGNMITIRLPLANH